MKASDLFVKCLEREGVKYIFGLPGEENLDLLNSLQSSSITFISTRHEQAAAFMADVYGRLTGRKRLAIIVIGALTGIVVDFIFALFAGRTVGPGDVLIGIVGGGLLGLSASFGEKRRRKKDEGGGMDDEATKPPHPR